ncbi:hypothetical protein WJX72_004346 [[Myrmecia] bisecta]|uniref:beta-carotene 3-hydroxylase n=1 Tax=[Myrmecia] bisecta TaxID=41462 RepID=A0AAW1R6N6_9CHLO
MAAPLVLSAAHPSSRPCLSVRRQGRAAAAPPCPSTGRSRQQCAPRLGVSVGIRELETQALEGSEPVGAAATIAIELASMAEQASSRQQGHEQGEQEDNQDPLLELPLARRARRARQQLTYKILATASTAGVGAVAVAAVYYRIVHLQQGGEFPLSDAIGTLTLTLGGVVGMEAWARWAHQALWHDFQPGWGLHRSHHEPRVGPFEANDIFAVVNAVPAMGLCLYGFLTPTLVGSLCFGAGLGITLFGCMYMFVHDGLVHKRFPVGPLANLPYLQRVAAAHQLHHANKFGGKPWGLFLGPLEVESQEGGREELDRLVASRLNSRH